MKQQVNLYFALPKRFIIKLPFYSIVNICLILTLGLAGISAYAYWQKRDVDLAIKGLESTKINIVTQIGKMKMQYGKKGIDLQLARDVKRLTQTVAMQNYIFKTLENPASKGFLTYFDALSKQVVPNLWLTKIDITEGGKKINLIGEAYSLNLITLFVKNLQKDKAFKGKQIELAKAEQSGETGKTKQIDITHQRAVNFVIIMQERKSS